MQLLMIPNVAETCCGEESVHWTLTEEAGQESEESETGE